VVQRFRGLLIHGDMEQWFPSLSALVLLLHLCSSPRLFSWNLNTNPHIPGCCWNPHRNKKSHARVAMCRVAHLIEGEQWSLASFSMDLG
jgi:hypothetical protein